MEEIRNILDVLKNFEPLEAENKIVESKIKKLVSRIDCKFYEESLSEKPQEKYGFCDLIDNSFEKFTPKLNGKKFHWDIVFENSSSVFLDKLNFIVDEIVEMEKCAYPKILQDTPFALVHTEEALNVMVKNLSSQKIIAVDLEHNSDRSFLGMTCLMQISTLEEDYIVFHGANRDVLWLQRDFGIHVINLFDTFRACKELNYPVKSLSYLLKKHCSVVTNKTLQLADWRIRPLSAQMVKYARIDTHYLIYIAQKMIAELLQLGLASEKPKNHFVKNVFLESKEVAKQQYFKPEILSMEKLLFKQALKFGKFLNENSNVPATKKQLCMSLDRLLLWRDLMARTLDEGLHYILPIKLIWKIYDDGIPESLVELQNLIHPPPFVTLKHGVAVMEVLRNLKETETSQLMNSLKQEKPVGPSFVEHGITTRKSVPKLDLDEIQLDKNNNDNLTLTSDGIEDDWDLSAAIK
eukprot:snap_masked-scaffold_11-processed-gene-9.29-mRNA-1 protein AED:0.28 eAED:0.28 QI:0/0/0/1/1/1/2/0/464